MENNNSGNNRNQNTNQPVVRKSGWKQGLIYGGIGLGGAVIGWFARMGWTAAKAKAAKKAEEAAAKEEKK